MAPGAKGWLRDAALIALFGTAFLSFTGYQWLQGYHTALSLSASSLVFPVHTYLFASVLPLASAVFLFILLVVVVEGLGRTPWLRGWVRLDVLALAAATAAVMAWARMTWVLGGDGFDARLVRINGAAIVMAAVVAFFIKFVWEERVTPILDDGEEGSDPAKRSITWSLLTILLFWTLAAGFHGTIKATDLKDGCAHHEQVMFDPVPPGLENKSYIHILHHEGRYYLRDPDIGPDRGEALVVMDETVGSVRFTRVSARADC